jgi:hypothetical protein
LPRAPGFPKPSKGSTVSTPSVSGPAHRAACRQRRGTDVT